jgi:capsular polysaccharide transport system ATP-binding protein
MIVLERVTKTIRVHDTRKDVLSAVDIEIPSDRRIALLGSQSAHKDILIRLLAGSDHPTTGRIARFAEISYPVGILPGLSKDLSVRANVAHVARLYAADVWRTVNLVEMVLDIGPRFDRPCGELDSISTRYLAEVVALCLPFDTYLLATDRLARRWSNERIRNKPPDIETRIAMLFNVRFRDAGMIIPTADAGFAEQHCDVSLVLEEGRLFFADRHYFEREREKHQHARNARRQMVNEMKARERRLIDPPTS